MIKYISTKLNPTEIKVKNNKIYDEAVKRSIPPQLFWNGKPYDFKGTRL